jgi:hypothetical protein
LPLLQVPPQDLGVGVAVGQAHVVEVLHSGFLHTPLVHVIPAPQFMPFPQAMLQPAGVGVVQTQSLADVHAGFLQIPPLQVNEAEQSELSVQAPPHVVVQVQSVSEEHCGFLQSPPTQDKPSEQSLLSVHASLQVFFVCLKSNELLHWAPPVHSAALGLLSGAAGDTLCLPEIL